VATELEMVVDADVGRADAMLVPCWLEPLPLPLSPSRRLVRRLGPVIEIFALPVPHLAQDLAFRCGIAARLISDDLAGRVLQASQQLAGEPPGRAGAALALDQDVEHDPVLILGPPKVVRRATNAR